MPIYEYRCDACGAEEEILQRMSDPAPTVCSRCGKGPVQKLMPSSTSFALKGTGWYVTDFRGKSDKPATADTKSEPKADTKTDTPAATPAPAPAPVSKP